MKDAGIILQLQFFVFERMCAAAATTDCVGFIITSQYLTCAGYDSIALMLGLKNMK